MARISREKATRVIAGTIHHSSQFSSGEFAVDCNTNRRVKIVTHLRTYAPLSYFVVAHGNYYWIPEKELKKYESKKQTTRTVLRRTKT